MGPAAVRRGADRHIRRRRLRKAPRSDHNQWHTGARDHGRREYRVRVLERPQIQLAEAARTRQQPPPVRVTERVRRSWHGIGWRAPRLAVAIAGAGMLLALALGTLLISTQHQLRVQEAHTREIAAIMNAPDADIMTVHARTHGSATVVMSHAAHALVLTTARLPALPSTECYQVWLMGTHRTKSAGRLPPPKQGMTAPMIVAELAAGDRMGVTVEPTAGAASPSSPPVLMLALPSD